MSDDFPGQWSRRRFLETVGRVGGAAAAYETMAALGLIKVPALFAGPPNLPPGSGKGKKVLILGAGIAGLTAAYELRKADYEVMILEAKNRPGGRNFTVRRGDVIEEVTGTRQLCRFDEGLYLNAGPGRLPYHHTAVLDYCKVLGVPLEVYVMMARNNVFQSDQAFDAKPMTQRQIANDTRGWISELLANAVGSKSLDDSLSADDKKALLELLVVFGDLEKKTVRDKTTYSYIGSSRSGYEVDALIGECPVILEPLSLQNLLHSNFWNYRFYQSEEYEWQPTLFEPVGGMDGIVKGFLPHVGNLIRYNREVTAIHNTADGGVEVTHVPAGAKDHPGESQRADWCISTIPLPILNTIANNFSDDYRKAIAAVTFSPTCKVGWQANRRFWELDSQIYGGISYTSDSITQMWYPSHGYFTEKGVLTGAYNYGDDAIALGNMKPEERLVTAMAGAKKLHPRFDEWVPRDLGMSIAWQNAPYQLGGWGEDWDCKDVHYQRLLRPDGKMWVAGDQMSEISGWQEGAIRSAHWVLERIHQPGLIERPLAAAPQAAPLRKAPPSIKRRTRGLP